jgi:transcription termination/antitermination protein NusG
MVVEMLRGKDYECLLPTYPERRKYADSVRQVQVALFPGYVFSRFDPNRRLPILITPGVYRIVSLGKAPQPVEKTEIEALQRIMLSGALAKPWPYLRVGQRIRIERGSLTGIEGLLIQERGNDRLVVSVHFLQRSVSVELERDSIRPA